MKITNYSPSRQIGGNSWAIENENGQSFVIDYGIPLNYREVVPGFPHENVGFEEYLSDLKLTPQLPPNIRRTDAVKILLSHPHYDHYGNIYTLEKAGQSYRILLPVIEMAPLVRWIVGAAFTRGTLNGRHRFEKIESSSLRNEEFTIQCHQVRHSVPMSYCFELHNAAGKCILYTGDFLQFVDDKTLTSIVTRSKSELVIITEGTYAGELNPAFTEKESIDQLWSIHASRPDDYFITSVTTTNVERINQIVERDNRHVVFDNKLHSEIREKGLNDLIPSNPRHCKSLASLDPGDVLIMGASIDGKEDLEWWMRKEQFSFLRKNKGRVHFFFMRDPEFHPATGTHFDLLQRYLRFNGVHTYALYVRGHASSSYLFALMNRLEELSKWNSVNLTILPTHTRHPEVFNRWFPDKTHILEKGETFEI